MRSRYDLTEDSAVRSDKGSFYPDILTFPLDSFKFTEAAQEYYLTEADLLRIDTLMAKKYKKAEMDDIVMWLNGFGTIYDLTAGTRIMLPAKSDIEKFFVRHRQ